MLRRLDAFGYRFCLAQVFHLLRVVAGGMINARKGNERVQGMPFVFGLLHQPVGGFVFLGCLAVLPRLFVERTEISVAERYAECAARLCVECHRLAVIHPGRVYLSAMLEDGTEVGVVDGLS